MVKNVGEFLRELRLNSGYISIRQVGKDSGVSAATISRIESNIQHPLPGTLLRLSAYYKAITYKELMNVCGYLDTDSMPERLELYQQGELVLLGELRNYPSLHKELIENPNLLKYLDKSWTTFKEINEDYHENE